MKERNFHVVWEMDISATSPEDAARQARLFQADPDSTAVVFDVFDEEGELVRVDLLEASEKEAGEENAARDIFSEAALCVTFLIDDPDAEGPLVSKRGDLLSALAVSGIRSKSFSEAKKTASEHQKRVLQMLVSNNRLINDIMDAHGLLVGDLIANELSSIAKSGDKINLLQYQTRSIQSKTGLHAKTVSLEELRGAEPSAPLSWVLPNGLQVTFLH